MLAALVAVTVLSAEPDDQEAKAIRALDRRWQKIARLRPHMGVRELFGFALEAAASGNRRRSSWTPASRPSSSRAARTAHGWTPSA